jgi:ribosomal protein S27AE
MIYVLICLWFGLAGGVVGKIKGSSFFLWFMISGAVPVIGLLAAVLYRSERDEVRRQCPRCGNIVKLYDQVCMRCGEDMYFPDVAIEPETAARR